MSDTVDSCLIAMLEDAGIGASLEQCYTAIKGAVNATRFTVDT